MIIWSILNPRVSIQGKKKCFWHITFQATSSLITRWSQSESQILFNQYCSNKQASGAFPALSSRTLYFVKIIILKCILCKVMKPIKRSRLHCMTSFSISFFTTQQQCFNHQQIIISNSIGSTTMKRNPLKRALFKWDSPMMSDLWDVAGDWSLTHLICSIMF